MGNITKARALEIMKNMENAPNYREGVEAVVQDTANSDEFLYNCSDLTVTIGDDATAEAVYDVFKELLDAIVNAHNSKRNKDE